MHGLDPLPAPSPRDHDYMPTLLGLCRRVGCRRPQSEHMALLTETGTPREPHMARGVTLGPDIGPGRGPLTKEWKSWARVALTPVDSEYR